SDKSKKIITPESGDFREALFGKKLNDRGSYNLILKKEGYFTKTVTYNTVFDRPGQYDVHGVLDLALDPEVKDLRELVQINPINFDLNKYNIRPDAAKELDKIVEVMNKYPNMVVELGSHTDCRATKQYNMKLSDNRAKASAAYIKARITNPERIYGKGYGESRLLNDCECEGNVKSDCSEEEHAANRRTEFKVISTGDDKLKVVNTSTDSF
ncbi:MAG: OmpA family protein, partial [Crocinitomicaceae bacterium]